MGYNLEGGVISPEAVATWRPGSGWFQPSDVLLTRDG